MAMIEKDKEGRLEPTQVRHKTLSAYYPNLITLHDYILTAPGPSISGVIQESDTDEYKHLVKETICAFRTSVGDLRPKGMASGPHQEVVDRVLVEVARRCTREGKKDVLISSDKYAANDLPVNIATAGMGSISGGSTAIFRTKPWRILRARIGDDAFRDILLHASLFLPVQNNCFMQLCGEPVYERYQHRPSDISPTAGPPQPSLRRRKKKAKTVAEQQTMEVLPKRLVKPSPADTSLARQRLMYAHPSRRPNGTLVHGLPPQHILNKLSATPTPTDTASLTLLRTVFPSLFLPTPKTSSTTPIPRIRGSKARIPGMMGVMREILVRHRRCDYAKEVWVLAQRSGEGEGLWESSHSQVCRFATSCLRQVIGSSILGENNLKVLIRHARQFITAKQHETVSIHALVQGISINDITWLAVPNTPRPNPQEALKRRKLVEELVTWLFELYLVPLLRNTFYASETAATRYKIVNFPHEAWSTATRPHFAHLQDTFLQELDSNERYFAHQGPLGVAVVRLIPKPNGFRPIVNLGRAIRGQNAPGISTTRSKPLSANQVLRTVHQVLTYEKDRKRDQLGSCLFGTNEVFVPLSSFKLELMKLYGNIPQLYFVKMDIKAAFDTIKQDKMMDTISNLLDQWDHDYCLMMYCLLLPPASKASQGSTRRLVKQRAFSDDGSLVGFDDHAPEIAKPLRNAVLVDMVRRRHVTKEACMKLLRQHIKENVWQIGSKLYRQKEGIPQGSKISSLLCSIFYAALEAQHLSFVHRPGSRLLRYIDDFLFITDDLSTARRFVERMKLGFPEYGAHISPSKSLLSFQDYGTGAQAVHPDISGFPFCGFLIDMKTLDISMDHHRMLAGPIDQSFALRSNRRRGSAFVGWLSRQLENRNHVAYLDTRHNDIDTVHLNVFVNFAMTAMKIPHYFKYEDISSRRAESISHSICLAVEYTYIAGRARVKHASRLDPGVEHYGVKKSDYIFLAKTAILSVLMKKASRMKGIVGIMRRDLSGGRARYQEKQFEQVIALGMAAVQGAVY